jgi:hypothetical protein
LAQLQCQHTDHTSEHQDRSQLVKDDAEGHRGESALGPIGCRAQRRHHPTPLLCLASSGDGKCAKA